MRLIDLEVLNSFRELQTPDDPSFVKDFFVTFLEPMPKRLEDIRIAIETGDSEKLRQAAHSAKSSCLNLGAAPVVELFRQLEDLGKKSTVSGAKDFYLKVVPLLKELETEIYSLPEFKDQKTEG